jgi:alkylation response protein AidB-like acyl-CoA dehydrogenase
MGIAEDGLSAAVRTWIAESWDTDITVKQWWGRLADSGYGFPHWPTEWFGKSMSSLETAVVRREMASAHVLGPPIGVGTNMAAPVLFAHGSEDQRSRWLPALARGEERWCQFFSEPDAGSDLAGVRTQAVSDGDGWLVNGQKVWNSGTLLADRGILLARTEPDLPKHRGLSFFVIDVDQTGIEVRPIRQMNGRTEFNETFFNQARIGLGGLVGSAGDGWRAAMTTLSNERHDFAGGWEYPLVIVPPGAKGGYLERQVGEVMEEARHDELDEANTPPIHTADRLMDLAREWERHGDPVIRQRLAHVYAMAGALRWTAERAAAAQAAGRQPGPESSIGYVGGVRLLRLIRDLAAEIAGPAGLLTGPDAPSGGEISMTVLTVPCHGIQGGSEQIQMNILGERVLGLPREPPVDRDISFRESVSSRPRKG